MATPPSRDTALLIKAVVATLGLLIVGVIGIEAVVEGDATATIAAVTTPVGLVIAALVVLLKGGEVVQSVKTIETKTDEQTADLQEIKHAVNGGLTARITKAVNSSPRMTAIEGEMQTIKDDVRGIHALLEERLPPQT